MSGLEATVIRWSDLDNTEQAEVERQSYGPAVTVAEQAFEEFGVYPDIVWAVCVFARWPDDSVTMRILSRGFSITGEAFRSLGRLQGPPGSVLVVRYTGFLDFWTRGEA